MTYFAYEGNERARPPFLLRYFAELWRYRHLARNLVGADLRARFRRSHLGILWAALQPMGFAFVLAYVLHYVMQQPFAAFYIYVLAGFITWDLIASPINLGLVTLQNAEGYLRQRRIPLLIFQIRAPLATLAMFSCATLGFFVCQAALGETPPLGLHTLLLAPFVGFAFALMVPLCIIFSLLGTQLRDLVHITSMALQAVWMTSPVMMPRELFEHHRLQWLVKVNPAISLLDMFRDPMVYGRFWDRQDVITMAAWTILLWIIAIAMSISAGRKVVYRL